MVVSCKVICYIAVLLPPISPSSLVLFFLAACISLSTIALACDLFHHSHFCCASTRSTLLTEAALPFEVAPYFPFHCQGSFAVFSSTLSTLPPPAPHARPVDSLRSSWLHLISTGNNHLLTRVLQMDTISLPQAFWSWDRVSKRGGYQLWPFNTLQCAGASHSCRWHVSGSSIHFH